MSNIRPDGERVNLKGTYAQRGGTGVIVNHRVEYLVRFDDGRSEYVSEWFLDGWSK